jgi:hypothetical protein
MQGEHQALQAPSLVNLMASPAAFRKNKRRVNPQTRLSVCALYT